ncbi:MAG: hypothetical protein M9955_13440 [Rhizobiaceae bacterium]|nr:hypothetical protein [Rhizobiaceae bacterium]
MNPLLIKSFKASAAIGAYLIAKASGDKTVATAAGSTDKLVGITREMATDSGGMADLTLAGAAELILGGTVGFGDRLTSDANGKGIVVASVNGTVVNTIAIALADGVANDRIPVLLAPGLQSKPAS